MNVILNNPSLHRHLVEVDVGIARVRVKEVVSPFKLPRPTNDTPDNAEQYWYHYGGNVCFSEDFKEVWLCE